MTIKLGQKVKDSVTGFTGIATSRIQYLTGCDQIGISAKAQKDGKFPDTVYVDESRLDGTDLIQESKKPKEEKRGGPCVIMGAQNSPRN